MELEVGDVVLCTVDRIAGTVVFVKIEGNGEGSVIISEIAPGRIRNLRDYVVPKKRIVCKILRISQNGNIDLSLRRVTQKEKKEVLEQYKQEKSYKSLLKSILNEKAEKIIKEIEAEQRLFDFLQEAKEDSKDLERIAGKIDAKKILEVIQTQKQKTVVLKKEINLTSKSSNGVTLIKELLANLKNIEIKYISTGRYSVKVEAEDIKTADNKLKEILKDIEEKSKRLEILYVLEK